MKNYTSLPDFHIVAFSAVSVYKPYLFTVFLLLYLTGLIANSAIITVIYMDHRLHTPMYLFLSNLSLIDLCYTTVTVPKLLDMLLSGNYTMSFIQCFTQMHFFYGFAITEVILLLTMAYDRYVAICNPLHYHRIFSRTHCVQLMASVWIYGYLHSFVVTLSAAKLSLWSSYIHQFFCDVSSIISIASTNKEQFLRLIYIELIVLGFCPFFCSLMSYIKIISTILKIKSRDGRRKAFSTCSSHLSVLTVFYVTGAALYIMPQLDQYRVLELIITVLYTVVTPLLNPLTYTLQNTDVKRGIKRCIGLKIREINTF